MAQSSVTPTVLSIAGFDPYSGAGILADSKVIHALSGYALCVTTALTAQNSTGVYDVLPTPVEHFKAQLFTLLDDMQVDAVKIGMLANAEIVMVIAEAIEKYALKNIVLDTVLVSSSGKSLFEEEALSVMIEKLFPVVDVITPNIPEVNRLLDTKFTGTKEEIETMAKGLFDLGAKRVLIKGGHSADTLNATDYFVDNDFHKETFSTARILTTHTHGTGCVLSSGIAAYLAKGESINRSIYLAKEFLYQRLCTASDIVFKYCTSNTVRKEPLI